MGNLVLHVTSVHDRHDQRITHKECLGLVRHGYSVSLLVCDGKGDENFQGLKIIDVGFCLQSKLRRALVGGWKLFRGVRRSRAKILHFHDPEFLPLAILLSLTRVRIIYDIHENYPMQVRRKAWIASFLRPVLSWGFSILEAIGNRRFDGMVTVVPSIATRFNPAKTLEVRNYPMLEEFLPPAGKPRVLGLQDGCIYYAYIGGISVEREFGLMLEAFHELPENIRLLVGGKFASSSQEKLFRAMPGWRKVDFVGWVDRHELSYVLSHCYCGLIVLPASGGYDDALPVKMLEYMAASLPVIYSDFSFWASIAAETQCVAIPPSDVSALIQAIKELAANPGQAGMIGAQSRECVLNHFTWETELQKLSDFYLSLMPGLLGR